MELYQKTTRFVEDLLSSSSTKDIEALNLLRNNVLNAINDAFNEQLGRPSGIVQYLAADSITTEIVDIETGLCFRRNLPMRYEETGNGISLIGEDVSGEETQISFLSEAAYEKIVDITGNGINSPRCDGHDA